MTYYGYEVDPHFVDGGTIKWSLTGNGEYVVGKKDGRSFFLKRNIHVRYPDKSLPESAYNLYKADADKLVNKQELLAKLMAPICESDRIVKEEDHFWDSEGMYVTITACVPDILPDDYNFTAISAKKYLGLVLDFAERLKILHACGVIHGDLKEKNVLVKLDGGAYKTYLIDFDTSYAATDIPEWDSIAGTDGYQSPEVLLYGSDEGASDPSTITTATDIFTMALIMHRWWTGSFPTCDLDAGASVGVAAYLGKKINIDNKFDVKIGANCGATLMSLINWMLIKEPSDRPTAEQVISVLKDESAVPEKYHTGSDDKPFDTTPWRAHSFLIEILPVDELKALGVVAFKKVNEGKGMKGIKYKVTLSDGTENSLAPYELVSAGYAKKLDAQLEEPWPEHEIEFESADKITAKGYVRIRTALQGFHKRYIITMDCGLEIDQGHEWLIKEGLAHYKIKDDIAVDTPWPEHGTEYDFLNMSRLHIISASRVEIGGEHRYKLVYDVIVDGKQKVNESVSGNNMKLMGLIK